MGKRKGQSASGCRIILQNGGEYELTYSVYIPPTHRLDAVCYLRQNGVLLPKSRRKIRKRSGYSLTLWERTRCHLNAGADICLEFRTKRTSELADGLHCSVFAQKL